MLSWSGSQKQAKPLKRIRLIKRVCDSCQQLWILKVNTQELKVSTNLTHSSWVEIYIHWMLVVPFFFLLQMSLFSHVTYLIHQQHISDEYPRAFTGMDADFFFF